MGEVRQVCRGFRTLDAPGHLPLIAAMTEANPRLPPNHPKLPPRRVGVLLVNLGTPDATDYWSMRRYLSEFLSDRRVIEETR